MVSPQARRDVVDHVMAAHQMGITRACGLIGISRSLYGYQSKRPDDGPLKERGCVIWRRKSAATATDACMCCCFGRASK